MLKDVISVVSDNNTNINSANVKSKGKVGIIELGIELDNIDTLRRVMTALQAMPDVLSVKRIQTSFNQAPQQFTKKNNKHKTLRYKFFFCMMWMVLMVLYYNFIFISYFCNPILCVQKYTFYL